MEKKFLSIAEVMNFVGISAPQFIVSSNRGCLARNSESAASLTGMS